MLSGQPRDRLQGRPNQKYVRAQSGSRNTKVEDSYISFEEPIKNVQVKVNPVVKRVMRMLCGQYTTLTDLGIRSALISPARTPVAPIASFGAGNHLQNRNKQ